MSVDCPVSPMPSVNKGVRADGDNTRGLEEELDPKSVVVDDLIAG